MVELFGKNYYLDIDGISDRCRTGDEVKDEEGRDITEINIFKYEVIKMCIDRVLSEYDDSEDEGLGKFGSMKPVSISFKIAFNTLIKNQILIEDDEQ
jgi:hypothetical protein